MMPSPVSRIAAAAAAAAFAFALDAAAHVLSGDDKDFLERAAQSSRAEIELGELAQRKGMRDEVRSFAERMVKDHRKATEEIARIAQARGLQLPAESPRGLRDDKEELAKLVGPEFDRAYMKRMLDEHEEAVERFEKQAQSAEDPDVRAFAQRQLLALRGHYQAAQGTFGLTTRTDREYGSRKK